jgi:hypothetical protein
VTFISKYVRLNNTLILSSYLTFIYYCPYLFVVQHFSFAWPDHIGKDCSKLHNTGFALLADVCMRDEEKVDAIIKKASSEAVLFPESGFNTHPRLSR